MSTVRYLKSVMLLLGVFWMSGCHSWMPAYVQDTPHPTPVKVTTTRWWTATLEEARIVDDTLLTGTVISQLRQLDLCPQATCLPMSGHIDDPPTFPIPILDIASVEARHFSSQRTAWLILSVPLGLALVVLLACIADDCSTTYTY